MDKKTKSSLIKQKDISIEITPIVESLSGVISLDKEFDIKDEYVNYFIKKYE